MSNFENLKRLIEDTVYPDHEVTQPSIRAKASAFRAYVKARKMETFVPRHCSNDMAKTILTRRQEQITEFERIYPDFRDEYNRMKKD